MIERRPACLPVASGFLFMLALDACSASEKPAGGGGSGGSPAATGGSGGPGAGGSGGGGGPTGGGGGPTGGGGGPTGGGGGSDAAAARDSAPAGDAGRDASADGATGPDVGPIAEGEFSFFVTSLEGIRRLSKSPNGFGGNLTYGQADGISGADKICSELAESSLAGSGPKPWRAFLSAARGPGGVRVDAIDRVGEGPWFDRLGRVLARTKADLLNVRPRNAHPAIINDLPNEFGVPNHRPDPNMGLIDNHHFLTGSDVMGRLVATGTCDSWTSTAMSAGRPRYGFAWPMQNRLHWISGSDEAGCGAGIDIDGGGGPVLTNPVVGSGGGYGGFYCFVKTP